MLRIAINGYGRIGRCVLRAIYERQLEEQLNVVAINDLADASLLAHLTRHDSTHGPFQADIQLENQLLCINQNPIQLFAETNPAQLPWKELGIDMVIECSGISPLRDQISAHLQSGVKHLLVSHPMKDADISVVYGVNHHQLSSRHQIISNASCTTNCLAPMAKVLNDTVGIVSGAFTTIHAYTNDQHLLDQAPGDAYRCRAAGLSMIPTQTGAGQAVAEVIPELDGKLSGMAVRVPTPNVSLVDFHFVPSNTTSIEEVNWHLKEASLGSLKNILNYSEEPLVSVDFNHHPASCIFDATQTRVIDRPNTAGQVKVMGWYDNEWGFTNRMLDVALHLHQLPPDYISQQSASAGTGNRETLIPSDKQDK